MNIVGYLRVSSKSQLDGDGLERQRNAIEQFCDRHKLECLEFFEERGVSGDTEGLDRPAFAELIQFVEQQRSEGERIEGIVVERMDRLARDLMVSEVLTQTCRKKNLKIFSADQGALIDVSDDNSDPTRTLIRQIMGALAQWEKNMLVQKLAAARKRAASEKGSCGGIRPFGELATDKIAIKFLSRAANTIPINDIVRLMNEEGLVTRRGTPWSFKTVWKALKTMRNRGLINKVEEDDANIEAEQIESAFRVNL